MKKFGITAKQAAANMQRAARAGGFINVDPEALKPYIARKERRFAIMRLERSIGNLIKPIVIPVLNFLNKLL